MEDTKSGFSQILKATSLFGGVQVFTIIFSIARTKFVAVLLGPAGLGIIGLYNSTIEFFGAATNFGLSTTGVRDLAEAHNEDDESRVARTISVIRNLVWITGLLGMSVLVLLSPVLSRLVFGSSAYTLGFVIVSMTLLFNQLMSGRMVLMQGLRRLSLLAKCSILNAFASLIISVPLYYFFGEKGIVPAIISISITGLVIAWYFSNKVSYHTVHVSLKNSLIEGKGMLRLGFFIGLSGLMALGSAYILRIFISNVGNLEDVGFYNAGFAIINTYVGLVFSAMATDYFPRLSGVIQDVKVFSKVVNQQMEIAILLLGPILCWFIIYINPVIVILYSNAFEPINEMLLWSGAGMIFKGIGWSLGFVVLAKGNSKLFFNNELIALVYQFLLNIGGYYFFGLKGLGVAFFISYVLYSIQILAVCRWKYKFLWDSNIVKKFSILFLLILLCLGCFYFLPTIYQYIVGSLVSILASIYTVFELNRSTDFLSKAINKFKNRGL